MSCILFDTGIHLALWPKPSTVTHCKRVCHLWLSTMNLHHFVSLAGIVIVLAAIAASVVALASPSWSRYESGGGYVDYNPYTTARLITSSSSTNAVLTSLALWVVFVAKLKYLLNYMAIDTRIYSIRDHTLTTHDVVTTKISLLFVLLCEIGLVAYINNNIDYPDNVGYGVNLHTHTDAGYNWWLASVVLGAVAPIATVVMAIRDKTFYSVIASHRSTGGRKTKSN